MFPVTERTAVRSAHPFLIRSRSTARLPHPITKGS
nr:MAG TPA: hypothetical protein [Caudoviricetes sp.]